MKKILESLNVIRMTCMPRFVAKLVFILFSKYKNKSKKLEML